MSANGGKLVFKRKSKPKVRTGCRTCKCRRVKCDEGKPFCKRCIDSKWECDGYEDLEKAQSEQVTWVPHKLLPKTNPRMISRALVPGIRFESEREISYFRLFEDHIATEISGGSKSTLWNIIIPQACDNHLEIRQLVLATAALRQLSRPQTRLAEGGGEIHRANALEQYGRALRGIKISIESGRNDLRIMLIAALLIFCIEIMYGDNRQAVSHVMSALQLIRERVSTQRRHLLEDLMVHDDLLPRKIPQLVEDEILEPYVGLDNPAVGLICPSLQNRVYKSQFYLGNTDCLPDRFNTLAEARDSFERIKYQVRGTAFDDRQDDSTIQPFLRQLRVLDGADKEFRPAIVVMQIFSASATHERTLMIVQQFERWREAFTPLLEQAKTNSSTFVPTTILSIQVRSMYICLRGYDVVDDFDPLGETWRLFNLCRSVVAHPKFSKAFVFEIGIILPLWLHIVLAPDHSLKRDAIKILRDMEPRIECMWDSRVVADSGEALVRILEREENNL